MDEEKFLFNVGQNIDRYRREQRMTVVFLGEKIGMAKSNLSPILKGKKNITLLTLFKIATALQVDIKKLLE
jgi:transcriptional regulator with XRE-family HTH domain